MTEGVRDGLVSTLKLTRTVSEGSKVLKMEDFELIRRLVLVDGLSRRQVALKLSVSRKSIQKALLQAEPEKYKLSTPRPCPVTDGVVDIVKHWLNDDKSKPRKQRHTRTRIFERLRDEYQFTGSRRIISDLVNKINQEYPEVFCPIEHPPGDEFQIDWGQATVCLAGQDQKVMIFCARSAYSKATFVRAYLRDDMISFLDAHVWLLSKLGGVPKKLAYDNLKTAVSRIHSRGERDLTQRFIALRSHYLFESRFCNVESGNEKGHVENSVKRAERTYLTPVPKVQTLDALNDHLDAWTKRDLARIDANTKRSYGDLFDEERKTLRPLPPTPFLACTTQSLRVDKRSTVPHDQSRYSVPVAYATKHIVLRAFIDRVEVLFEDKTIATHDRVAPGDWALQLSHYLPLLETKPGLLDSGKPFKKQAWTPSQELFRNELEYRYQGEGTRRFIDVLLLAKSHEWNDVCRAIDACCKNHAFSEQAVLLELQRDTNPPTRPVLDLSGRPELEQDGEGLRHASYYDTLVPQAASVQEADCPGGDEVPMRSASPTPVSLNPFTENSVSQDLARSAKNDEKEIDTATKLPRLGIPSSVLEATNHTCGVLACVAAM